MAPSGQLSSRATLLALALLLVVRLAAAQPPPAIQILWSAPPSCPSQSDVEAEVSRTIGARATRPEPLRARMEVWQSEAGGWKGDIELSAASQVTRRQVHGDTCKAVASAVAIVISVAAIDDAAPGTRESSRGEGAPVPAGVPGPAGGLAPVSPDRPRPPEVVPPDAPPSPPTPTPPVVRMNAAPTAPAPITVTTRGPRRVPPIVLGASALVDVGSLPAVAPGVELFLGLRPGRWRFEAAAAYLATQSGTLTAAPTQGANLSQIDVGARAWVAWGWSRFEAGPSVGARAAWVAATGFRSSTPESGTGQVLAGSLGARGAMHLARWASLHMAADLVAPVDRPSFVIRDGGTVFRPSALAFRGGIGLDAQF
jgi:hypothetical protein